MYSERTHIIRLVQNPGAEGLGFKFVGGLEFGVGIFVCEIIPKSQAEKKGLKVYSKEGRNGYIFVISPFMILRVGVCVLDGGDGKN